MKLSLNLDYARRHLFVTILMFALSCWFAYDGFIKYPKMSAAELYFSIEKKEPAENTNLEAFKEQKIQTQHGFTFITLIVALVVGSRLLKSYRFKASFDDDGFSVGEKTFTWAQIKRVNNRAWEKKRIVKVIVSDGEKFTFDAWHHNGVKELHEKLPTS